MIGGSRDAQNRCVPVISLFNAVMLMGLSNNTTRIAHNIIVLSSLEII
jgi:hypothetical protein